MGDIAEIPTPDDSGSDTVGRFIYQADVAFRYCLNCGLNQGVRAVYMEHIEDVIIASDDSSILCQIKTRDPELGPWRLRHLWGDSGALHSIVRSHRAIVEAEFADPIHYQINLEGALLRGDPIEHFADRDTPVPDDVQSTLEEKLQISRDEARDICDRLHVISDTTRDSIVAKNLRLLSVLAPTVSSSVLKAVYDGVMAKIVDAMRAERLDELWPTAVLVLDDTDDAPLDRVDAKRLDEAALSPLLEPLGTPSQSALVRIDDAERLSATTLEEKLRLAGASTTVIDDAKQLRAHAAAREFEVQAAQIYNVDQRLADSQERVRLRARAVAAGSMTANGANADSIWNDVMAIFHDEAGTLDPKGSFIKTQCC